MHLLISPALLSILVLPILSWLFLTSIFFCTPTSAPLSTTCYSFLRFCLKHLLLWKSFGTEKSHPCPVEHSSKCCNSIKAILIAPFNLTTACLTVRPSHWSVSSVPKTVFNWHLINIWYILVHLNWTYVSSPNIWYHWRERSFQLSFILQAGKIASPLFKEVKRCHWESNSICIFFLPENYNNFMFSPLTQTNKSSSKKNFKFHLP